MAVSKAARVWAYRSGLVPFTDLPVGAMFTHASKLGELRGTVFVKTSKNGWYTERDNRLAKWRTGGGTAVKAWPPVPDHPIFGSGHTPEEANEAARDFMRIHD